MRTGRNLRDLDSVALFEVGYALMEERMVTPHSEEYIKSRTKFEERMRDIVLEDETGIPAAVRRFASADASQYVGGGDK